MSLDASVARREARRRKILENSENRLKRITGRNPESKRDNSECSSVESNGFECNGSVIMDERDEEGFVSKKAASKNPPSELQPSMNFHDISSLDEVKDLNSQPSIDMKNSNDTSVSIFIFGALICRILIELDLHYIFASSTVIAYILISCGMFTVNGLPTTEISSLIGSLLLFSGISSKKIKLFLCIVRVFSCLLKDFALYMFAFVFFDICIMGLKYIFT